ncbi:MAG: hypothetical protein H0W49_01325 [Nitrospirales bacterium]|nr:hypothetical protein [Nitrospirales bacterium]
MIGLAAIAGQIPFGVIGERGAIERRLFIGRIVDGGGSVRQHRARPIAPRHRRVIACGIVRVIDQVNQGTGVFFQEQTSVQSP